MKMKLTIKIKKIGSKIGYEYDLLKNTAKKAFVIWEERGTSEYCKQCGTKRFAPNRCPNGNCKSNLIYA